LFEWTLLFALKKGFAINLGGGYHHAHGYGGGGFCVYSDITLSIRCLREYSSDLKKVMIIDLDAHQGNGHERDKLRFKDDDTYIVDVYNYEIYPDDEIAKRAINTPIELASGVDSEFYLHILREALEEAFSSFEPQIIYYNAGSDILKGDPLGRLDIEPSALIERDEIVFQYASSRGIPIVLMLSGGYQKSASKTIATSIHNLIQKFKKTPPSQSNFQ